MPFYIFFIFSLSSVLFYAEKQFAVGRNRPFAGRNESFKFIYERPEFVHFSKYCVPVIHCIISSISYLCSTVNGFFKLLDRLVDVCSKFADLFEGICFVCIFCAQAFFNRYAVSQEFCLFCTGRQVKFFSHIDHCKGLNVDDL